MQLSNFVKSLCTRTILLTDFKRGILEKLTNRLALIAKTTKIKNTIIKYFTAEFLVDFKALILIIMEHNCQSHGK